MICVYEMICDHFVTQIARAFFDHFDPSLTSQIATHNMIGTHKIVTPTPLFSNPLNFFNQPHFYSFMTQPFLFLTHKIATSPLLFFKYLSPFFYPTSFIFIHYSHFYFCYLLKFEGVSQFC